MDMDIEKLREDRQQAQDKLIQLQLRRDSMNKRIAELHSNIDNLKNSREDESLLVRRAKALLEGKDLVEASVAIQSHEQELNKLTSELPIVLEACRLMANKLQDTIAKLSKAEVDLCRPELAEKYKRYARKLGEVIQVAREIKEYRDDFTIGKGLNWGFFGQVGLMNVASKLGDFNDQTSNIMNYYRELINESWLSRQDVDAIVSDCG